MHSGSISQITPSYKCPIVASFFGGKLACVASVSFPIFDRARIGASAKRVALAPILARSKIGKSLRMLLVCAETLATQASGKFKIVPLHSWY